jgi:DHA2 family multidrug resistance protein
MEGASVVEFGWRRQAIVVAVMLASLLETLDSTIVNVALPTIEGNIGASLDEGVWIVTGYIISNVVSIPLNPFLTRMFGRKAYFAACIIGFTAASFLCSTAHTLPALVAFRLLQGAFGGGLIATAQVVMRETFPPEKIGISSALFAMALILGPAFGPLAGGYITDNFSWQWIFDVNILPGIIASTIIVLLLRDPVPPARLRIDWAGVALLATGLGCLQFLLDNGERRDWFSDPQIASAGIVSLCALAAFGWWQWNGSRAPVVDLHVLRYRSVWVGSLIALAFGALIFAPAILTPLYSSLILGYTPWDSGLLLALRAVPVVLLTPVFATLSEKGADVRYFLTSGFLLSAASLVWMAFHMTANTPFAPLGLALFVSGIGQSMLLVPLIVGVLSTTPAQLNSKISPIITLSVQLGGSIASAGAVAFFDRRTSLHSAMLGQSITWKTLNLSGVHGTLSQLASIVMQQASTMAFADAIFAAGMLALVVAPLVLAFPRSKGVADESGTSLAH